MKILFICDEYPPGNNGGIGATVQNLGREIVKQGHSVYVVGLYSYRYGEKNKETDQGVEVWRLRYGLNLGLSYDNKLYTVFERLPDRIKRNLNGKRAYKKYIKFLEELIISESIDVIEIGDFNNFAMYIGFPITWPAFSVPMVLKSHGSYTYFCRELGQKALPELVLNDRLLFERADAFSCVSHYTAGLNKKIFNIASKIRILYNGVHMDENPSRVKNERQTIVFTGTLVYKKGIYSLLKAWNNISGKLPGVELLVFGKGDTRKLKKTLSSEVMYSVHFEGHVSREKLFKEMREAMLAVFPSYSETFGMGVVEAMSVGCPVIYTKRSCGPEIVKDGVEGILVDPENIKELEQNILSLAGNIQLREKLAENALDAVKSRFNIKTLAREHIEFYNDVITDFKQKRVTNQ